jgi:hypothetical protein
MATILDVDSIATDADLIAEVASAARLERANKSVTQRDAIRHAALEDVLEALKTRSPPLTDTMLADATELKRAVVYRSLTKIFLSAIAVEGDIHAVLHTKYEREYQAAVRARFSTTPDLAASASGFSFRMERR